MVVGFYKTVAILLKQNGYVQIQNAKGSHEKWVSARTSKPLIVPRNLMSRHTANAILKDANINDRV
jgi:predicted RNA binding protein YcfA (HicA-like mRNA interferase family)